MWPFCDHTDFYSSIPHVKWCQMPWSLYPAADSPVMVQSRLIVTSFSMLVGRQRLFFSQCYRLQMWFFTPTTPTASLWADIHHGESHILPFVLAPVTLSPSLVVDDGSWTLFSTLSMRWDSVATLSPPKTRNRSWLLVLSGAVQTATLYCFFALIQLRPPAS